MHDDTFYTTVIGHKCTHFKTKMCTSCNSVCKWQPLRVKRQFNPTGPSDTRFVQFQKVVTTEYLQLEPFGVLFVTGFGIILTIQFIAMLIHRFGTLSHMLATTQITWFQRAAQVSGCIKNFRDWTYRIKCIYLIYVWAASHSN
jgi:hypothetical protein